MKFQIKDKWFRYSSIFLLVIASMLVDDYYRQPLTGLVFIKFLLTVGSITVTWYLCRTILLHWRNTFPPKKQNAKRLLLTFISIVVAKMLLSMLSNILEHLFVLKGTIGTYFSSYKGLSLTINGITMKLSFYGFDLLFGIQYALFFMTAYGVLFFVRNSSSYRQQLKVAEHEKEELRMAHLQSQLEALKQHVNPHFLFNALNSLSALISEDPPLAEKFVDNLSEVYRYLLRANQQHLTTLEAELQFLNAYFHLLQTRFGAALQVDIDVSDSYLSYQLPPLSLQLLVENAVKHNVASSQQPLLIQIMVDHQQRLLVSNTLQRKTSRVLSNGVGLSNIVTKYQMLNLPQPMIFETETQFTVALPLLT